MSKPQLSAKVRELIQKARIVSFATWQQTHAVEIIQRFQAADDQGRYLTDEDLQLIENSRSDASEFICVTKILRDNVSDIVNEARNQVLETFPNITQPGGGLYPSERADACWRDFWHFLRCITYGIAGQRADYTSSEGLYYMQQLYQELQVPLDAMVVGLQGIKNASIKRVSQKHKQQLAPYFNHLIEQLRKF